ncbi:hypothetical protein LXL04_022615 [Taraxacum kok-saghyz]
MKTWIASHVRPSSSSSVDCCPERRQSEIHDVSLCGAWVAIARAKLREVAWCLVLLTVNCFVAGEVNVDDQIGADIGIRKY